MREASQHSEPSAATGERGEHRADLPDSDESGGFRKLGSLHDIVSKRIIEQLPAAAPLFIARDDLGAIARAVDPKEFLRSQRVDGPYRVRGAFEGGPNAAFLVHAVGMAWGQKMKKDSACTFALFSDVLVEAGEFHNALNFLGVLGVPGILIGVAMGESGALAERGVAYGLPSKTLVCTGWKTFKEDTTLGPLSGPLLLEINVRALRGPIPPEHLSAFEGA